MKKLATYEQPLVSFIEIDERQDVITASVGVKWANGWGDSWDGFGTEWGA